MGSRSGIWLQGRYFCLPEPYDGKNTGRFIMFSVITNIYNKKPNCLKSLLLLEILDVSTTGDTAHIHMIFKFLPHTYTHTHIHTHQHGCIDILPCCNYPCLLGYVAKLGRTKFFSSSLYLCWLRKHLFYIFPILNLCNHGVY